MPLGGFGTLPLPLGGTPENGLTAEQHARACADLSAVCRTAPFACVAGSVSGAAVTIDHYIGMNGVGLAHAPTATYVAAGRVLLEWDDSYEDDYGVVEPTNIKFADAGPAGTTCTVVTADYNAKQVYVQMTDSAGSYKDDDFFAVAW